MHNAESSDNSVATKGRKTKKANTKKDGNSSKKKKLHRVTIYLTDDQIEYLDDVANKIKVKRSTYIRMLIDSDMKGPVMPQGPSHVQWRTSSAAAPYVPPRQRRSRGSSRPMDSGKMKVHAELMNELKNVLKKRKVDGGEEPSAADATKGKEASDKTEEETKKEKWKEKAKWATPPPPPPPPPS